jgi:hypothetical protein
VGREKVKKNIKQMPFRPNMLQDFSFLDRLPGLGGGSKKALGIPTHFSSLFMTFFLCSFSFLQI